MRIILAQSPLLTSLAATGLLCVTKWNNIAIVGENITTPGFICGQCWLSERHLKCRSVTLLDTSQYMSLLDKKCKKDAWIFSPPDAFNTFLTVWFLSPFLTFTMPVSLFGKYKNYFVLLRGLQRSEMLPWVFCLVFAQDWENHTYKIISQSRLCRSSEFPQPEQWRLQTDQTEDIWRFSDLSLLCALIVSNPFHEMQRTHFNAALHSICLFDCRIHHEVLICATVIAPDHPQF